MEQRKVKLGLVGCGKMMYSHCLSMLEAGNIEITAVCDINLENAKKTAEQLGIDKTYYTDDYRTMIGKCEAVLLPLPHNIHYEVALFFARHKVHVLVEKNMCASEEECRRLIKACEEEGADVRLSCALPSCRCKAEGNGGQRRLRQGDYDVLLDGAADNAACFWLEC